MGGFDPLKWGVSSKFGVIMEKYGARPTLLMARRVEAYSFGGKLALGVKLVMGENWYRVYVSVYVEYRKIIICYAVYIFCKH